MTEEFSFGKANIIIQGPNGNHVEFKPSEDMDLTSGEFGIQPKPGVLIHRVKVEADEKGIVAFLYADLGFYELHLEDMKGVGSMKPPFRIHLEQRKEGKTDDGPPA